MDSYQNLEIYVYGFSFCIFKCKRLWDGAALGPKSMFTGWQ